MWNGWTIFFASIYLLCHGFEFILDILQRKHLFKRRGKVPKHLEGKVDPKTAQEAADYNRSKIKLGMYARIHGAVATAVMIALGFRWLDARLADLSLSPIAVGLLFFGILGGLGIIWDLPLELISTFGIEAKWGFNKETPKSFIIDKLKGMTVSAVLGAAFLFCVLLLMEKGGDLWWLYAFFAVLGIQLLMLWIYPVAIMPLFNKFTPVTEDLAENVAEMARKVGFKLEGVVSMDGSRRSTHSNAFFTGLFGAKRVVLYDTLIEKIGCKELLAVLAHEFGHFKLKHLARRLVLMSASLFILFVCLSYFRDNRAIHLGLGFDVQSSHASLIVFVLIVSQILAPFTWLSKLLSRRDEYAADRFAVDAQGTGDHLKEALIALTKQNLSSPGSHKWYRSYHNSHPTLKSRLKAIDTHAAQIDA